MRGGALWALETSGRPTSETESGFLPTPVKYDVHGTWESNNYHGLGWLGKNVWGREQMYPTPIKSDANISKTDYVLRSVEEGKAFNQLAREVHKRERVKAQTWPTPLKSDVKGGSFGIEAIENWATKRGTSAVMLSQRVKVRQKAEWSTPTKTQPVMPQATLEARMVDATHRGNTSVPLVEALQRVAFAERGGDGPVEYEELNPSWVEWLMGWPFGWTSLEPMDRASYDLWERMITDGTWWLSDPSEGDEPLMSKTVPKSALPHREDQIAALGNGQVSAVCAAQFVYLMDPPDLQQVPEDYPE